MEKRYGNGRLITWAKHDPVRTDLDAPANIRRHFAVYEPVFKRYGKGEIVWWYVGGNGLASNSNSFAFAFTARVGAENPALGVVYNGI